MSTLGMKANASVLVSGVPDHMSDQMLKELMIQGEDNCGIRQMVMFRDTRTAMIEFSTPELAARILTSQEIISGTTRLQIKGLLSTVHDQSENMRLQQENEKQTASFVIQNQDMTIKQLQAAIKRQRKAYWELEKQAMVKMEQLKEQGEADKRELSLYDMSHTPRGIAVIINNINFENKASRRNGAEGDTDRLRETFESLGFIVQTFRDLDHAKMVATMKEQGKADHTNYDCFVCVIMSHGTTGKVISTDDVGIDICELMYAVNAKKCPSLKGKPKLFFIQACQGEKLQGRESFDGDHDIKPALFVSHEADFFLGLATVPGYVAIRDPEKGAPYVHHLANLLKDFGPTHNLSAIMAMVCDKMNEIDADESGWISSNHSTLRKSIIFHAN